MTPYPSTPEEVQKRPLVTCPLCGNKLSLLPELHHIWKPVMRGGVIYHAKCLYAGTLQPVRGATIGG